MNIEKVANYLSGKTGFANIDLLAKDAYLQGILLELAHDGYFNKNFVFKGGSCLVKVYFGYYRFSEDLDFSWINQKEFEGISSKQVRRLLSRELNETMGVISKAGEKLGLDFRAEKSNRRYVELGGSNRFVTFKLWYRLTNRPESFIKIQISFVEKFFHKFRKKELNFYPASFDRKELEILLPEESHLLLEKPEMKVYDLREIAAEKIRAALTRRGIKARDMIDLYFLSKHGVQIKAVRDKAIEKIKLALKYLKYSKNIAAKKGIGERFDIDTERYLLMSEMGDDFLKFSESAFGELREIAKEALTV